MLRRIPAPPLKGVVSWNLEEAHGGQDPENLSRTSPRTPILSRIQALLLQDIVPEVGLFFDSRYV